MKKIITNSLLSVAVLSSAALAQAAEVHENDNVDIPFDDISIQLEVPGNAYSAEKVESALNVVDMMGDYETSNPFQAGVMEQLNQVASLPYAVKMISDNPNQLLKALSEVKKDPASIHKVYDALSNEALLAFVKSGSQMHAEINAKVTDLNNADYDQFNSFSTDLPLVLGELKARDVDVHQFMTEHSTKSEYDAFTLARFGITDSDMMAIDVDLKDSLSGEELTLGQVMINGCVCESTLSDDDSKMAVIDPYGDGYGYGQAQTHLADVLEQSKGFFFDKVNSTDMQATFTNGDDAIVSVKFTHDNERFNVESKLDVLDKPITNEAFSNAAVQNILEKVSAVHTVDGAPVVPSEYAEYKLQNSVKAQQEIVSENTEDFDRGMTM